MLPSFGGLDPSCDRLCLLLCLCEHSMLLRCPIFCWLLSDDFVCAVRCVACVSTVCCHLLVARTHLVIGCVCAVIDVSLV